MKPARREWALIAAYVLYTIFAFSMQTFMGIYAGPEKRNLVYVWNIAGVLFGALILSFILPLRDLRESSNHRSGRPFRKRRFPWEARLALVGIFFLPGLAIRFLGHSAWLASPANSAVMSFGTGIGTTLIYGCFFSLVDKNRAFWSMLSTALGLFVFYLALTNSAVLSPFLFIGSGIILAMAGVMVLLFLSAVPKGEEKSQPCETAPKTAMSCAGGTSRWFAIFPLLAALVIFWTNSITDRLFFATLNSPFNTGFNLPTIVLLLALPALGFLASLSWRRFLSVFIPLCSSLFLLSPALLLFNRSETLYLILYTLNTMVLQMLPALFPFVIVDLYWQDSEHGPGVTWFQKSPYGRDYLAWLLPVSVLLIRQNAMVQAGLFRNIRLDNAYAVIILTLAAIAFFILSYKSTMPMMDKISSAEPADNPDNIFRKHNLSERETEVARLMVREGLSDKEIGDRLFISPLTVRDHVTKIYRKFGVKRRAAFVAKALNNS